MSGSERNGCMSPLRAPILSSGCRYRKSHPSWIGWRDELLDFLRLFLHVLVAPVRTQAQLEAEVTLLRHQLNVLRRQAPSKPRLTAADRLLLVWLWRLFPSLRSAITIVQPDTVLRWHRSGFQLYWRWKSRSRSGRPRAPIEVRSLIRRLSMENPLWGAPRIHGELLKLGIEVARRRTRAG